MVYRLFVEKKEGLRVEAEALQAEIRDLLGVSALKSLRLLNRYDVEKIDQDLFEACIYTVLPSRRPIMFIMSCRRQNVFLP